MFRPTLTYRGLMLALLLLASGLWAGCGGGGGGGNDGDADALVAEGIRLMNRMISDDDPTDMPHLSACCDKFTRAHNIQPQHRLANGGMVVSKAAMMAERVADMFGATLGGVEVLELSNASPSQRNRLLRVLAQAHFGAREGALWTVLPQDLTPIGLRGMLMQAQTGSRSFPRDPTYDEVYAVLEDIQDELLRLHTMMESGMAMPTDANPLVLDNDGDPVKLGTAEFQVTHAGALAVAELLDFVLSYSLDFDPDEYPYDQTLEQAFPDLRNGGRMPPTRYLPGDPFFTFTAGARIRLARVRTNMMEAIDDAEQAVVQYRQRSDPDFLIGMNLTEEQRQLALGALAAVKEAFDDGTAIAIPYDGGTYVGTLNLGDWLQNPTSNLRAWWPIVDVHPVDDQHLRMSWPGTAVPDRTFGGLFRPALHPDMVKGSEVIERDDPLWNVVLQGLVDLGENF